LFWIFDISREQDHAGRLQSLQQRSKSRADLHSVEPDDQQLPSVLQNFLRPRCG